MCLSLVLTHPKIVKNCKFTAHDLHEFARVFLKFTCHFLACNEKKNKQNRGMLKLNICEKKLQNVNIYNKGDCRQNVLTDHALFFFNCEKRSSLRILK